MSTVLRLRTPILGQMEKLYVNICMESLGRGKIATEKTHS